MSEEPKKRVYGRPFVKGDPRIKPGRPPMSYEHKKLKQLTASEFAEIANLIVKGSIDQLITISKNKDEVALKVMLAAIAVKIMNKGDMDAMDKLLNRLVGKVPDKLNVRDESTMPRVVITLPDNGRGK